MSINVTLNRPWAEFSLQPWFLITLILVGLSFFFLALWPKLQVLLRARPENRFEQFRERLTHTLRIAIGQKKLFKRKGSGWMHAFIFWGFCILLLRAGQFFFIGLFPRIHVEGEAIALFWNSYLFLKDIFVILVTGAVLFALYRRLVIRPTYLTLSFQGIFILSLILVIMATDTFFEAAFFALHPQHAEPQQPLGYILSLLLGKADTGFLKCLHSASYWLHIGAIMVFLNLLPRSKHLHIITSFPNVFFARMNGVSSVSRIDFEDESREEFGIAKIEDFSWKGILDLHTCTECGRCDQVCPALNTGKPLSPKQFTMNLRDHLNYVSPAILSGENQERPALTGETISDDVLWSCTTCGACEEECPVEIEYVGKIIDLRRTLTLNENRYPTELSKAFKSLETNGNPWGFGKGTRDEWAKELGIKTWDKNQPTEYLYFVGCNGSFDSRGKKIAESVVKALKKAEVDFSILGKKENCTGDPARRAGNEYLFDTIASRNTETFRKLGIVKIVTHCPHCFNSLKNEYPEFGAKLDVIHHSELLAQLAQAGKFAEEKKTKENVVFHDSCYLGRHNGNYDNSRNVLKQSVEIDKLQEVEKSKERGTCCGAGGAGFLLEEKGTPVNLLRVNELMEAKPKTIAVSCPFCVLMLEDALKAKNLSDKVKVKDISEMLQ